MEAKEDAMVAKNKNPPGANVQNGSGPSERAHNTENASVNAIFKKIMHLAFSYVSGAISNASSKPKFAFELEKISRATKHVVNVATKPIASPDAKMHGKRHASGDAEGLAKSYAIDKTTQSFTEANNANAMTGKVNVFGHATLVSFGNTKKAHRTNTVSKWHVQIMRYKT